MLWDVQAWPCDNWHMFIGNQQIRRVETTCHWILTRRLKFGLSKTKISTILGRTNSGLLATGHWMWIQLQMNKVISSPLSSGLNLLSPSCAASLPPLHCLEWLFPWCLSLLCLCQCRVPLAYLPAEADLQGAPPPPTGLMPLDPTKSAPPFATGPLYSQRGKTLRQSNVIHGKYV